jgi:hypothetical protein
MLQILTPYYKFTGREEEGGKNRRKKESKETDLFWNNFDEKNN